MSNRPHNFNAGPAILPRPVLEEVQRDLLALPGVGLSILEISHRSKAFEAMLAEAEANLRRLLDLADDHHVLFLGGGASTQFSMVPASFLGDGSADYLVTGSWSAKAAKEAERLGRARRVYDGKAEGYVRVPRADELDLAPEARYVHLTSNETIHGVQFHHLPPTGGVPLIVDASSDFLSRPFAAAGCGLVYAGAQKNVGPAGVTLVLLRPDMLERAASGLPTMLDYRTHAENHSNYNTPPVFAIYVVLLVTRWLLNEVGGLEAMALANRDKAALLYETIDASGGFYRGHAQPDSRSQMNVAFRLADPELEARFLTESAAAGFVGLKGHRSVGGVRASIYNAMPLTSVEALADFMREFQRRSG